MMKPRKWRTTATMLQSAPKQISESNFTIKLLSQNPRFYVPTTPLLQAYHGRSLRLSSLRALIRKEFTSISCIAVSVRTGIALIFVLVYCALWVLEHNLNSRIIAPSSMISKDIALSRQKGRSIAVWCDQIEGRVLGFYER